MSNQFVAYQDERHGLGAWVAEQVAADLFRYGVWVDDTGNPVLDDDGRPAGGRTPPSPGARHVGSASYGMNLSAAGSSYGTEVQQQKPAANEQFNFAYRTWTSPRTTAEATVSAIVSQKAEIGVLPLYDNESSFNKETLAALIDYPAQNVVREYVAESNYVLAAPTDLIHEIEQAGYTDTFSPSGSATTFTWNRDKQQRYLRKVTTIFATADAMKHCQPALEGFRAQGIDVQLVPDGMDSYREGLRLASELLDPDRVVETRFSGNKHVRVSRSHGRNHVKPLIGVLLSADKAMKADGYNYDSDYTVLEAEMAGADRIRTSFIATKRGVPPMAPSNVNPVDFEMAMLNGHFRKPSRGRGGASADHRALYPIAGDSAWPSLAEQETPAMVRCLYKFDTVGNNVPDYSPVLRSLAEQGLSYQTTTLDNRPNHPMVVAVDVPSAKYKAMRPVLNKLMRLPNARRLADFPAIQPMVKEGIRPVTKTNERMRTAIGIACAAFAVVAAYVLWKL